MKIFRLVLLLVFISIQLLSLDFGFEAVGGRYTPNKEQNISNANMVGIRNNFYLFQDVALSLQYDFVDNKKTKNSYRYSMALRYQITNIDPNFQPFVDIGAGQELGNRKQKYLQATLGTKYYLANEFNILGEFNYIRKRYKSKSYFFALGIGYDFFRKPSLGKYSEKPIDEAIMKQLANQKITTKEDIFLSPY